MTEAMIRIENVSKHYGAVHAVDDVSLAVDAGQIFGLTGHNGAGKSTLFRMVLGILRPTSGRIRIRGERVERGSPLSVRRGIGYLPENLALYDNLSGLETMRFFARVKSADLRACAGLLERVGLAEAAHRKVREYSKGMRQRLGFAQALIGRPSLLLLDEPTNGLDPVATRAFYDMVGELRSGGTSVVISSHLLSEIESRVDALAIMANGRLVAHGSVADLGRSAGLPARVLLDVRPDAVGRAHSVLAEAGFGPVRLERQRLSFPAPNDRKPALIGALAALGEAVTGFEVTEPTLEDVFLRLSHRGVRA